MGKVALQDNFLKDPSLKGREDLVNRLITLQAIFAKPTNLQSSRKPPRTPNATASASGST